MSPYAGNDSPTSSSERVHNARAVSAIERVGEHTTATLRAVDQTGDCTVLAVLPADCGRVGDEAGPHTRCRALRYRLPHHFFLGARHGQRRERLLGHVATELGEDRAGMHRARALTRVASASIELDREQDVRRLRSSVCLPRVVRRAFEVDVVEHHVAESVTGGREIHDARRSAGEQRAQSVDEHEVTEVVRSELQLEAVGGATWGVAITPALAMITSRRSWSARTRSVNARIDASDARSTSRNSTVAPLVVAAARTTSAAASPLTGSRTPSTTLAPCATTRPRRLLSQSGRRARDQDPFARQIDAVQHLVRRRLASEAHSGSFARRARHTVSSRSPPRYRRRPQPPIFL